MPLSSSLSGSYYYPGINVANSSYPSVDIRQITALTGANSLGRLQVSGSDLYFIDPNGVVNNLSDTSGSQTFNGNVTILSGNLVGAGPNHLILTSSFGNVHVSGNLSVQEKITSKNGDLILSSSFSAGSNVFISGNLSIGNKDGTGGFTASLGINNRIVFDNDNDTYLYANADDSLVWVAGGNNQIFITSTALTLWRPVSIKSTSTFSNLVIGDTMDLTLSSSVGSSIIAISGTLKHHKVNEANLPAGSVSLSGSVLWCQDTKKLAIYGPEGWTAILTGAL